MAYTSFGTAIPVLGPKVGFPGNISRTGDRLVRSRLVSPTTATNLPFGAPAIEISNAVGGYYQSVADYLGTIANVANLQATFAGIAVRNVQTENAYLALAQNYAAGAGVTTTVSTTATGSAAASTFVVASAAGLVLGMSVEGTGVQAGTTVTGISGSTITLSLPLLVALSTTAVLFTAALAAVTGYFSPGQMADVLLRGNATVVIANGTPSANAPVYIRTVANASLPGTAVGDFEATDDLATSSITVGTTFGSTALATSAGTGLAAGQRVLSTYFPANTYLVSGATTSWVTSNPALATVASGGAASFYNTALLGSVFDPWIVFSTGQMDSDGLAEIVIKVRHSA